MKYHLLFVVLLAIVVVSGSMNSAFGPLYMKYGSIKGESTAQEHDEWIELNSFQFGVGRSISTGGSGSPREASAPSLSEIVVTKTMDKSSVPLFKEALIGKGDQQVMIHLTEQPQDKPQTYYQIELENTLISGFSISSGGDRPTESVSLSFTKIQSIYTVFDKTGIKGESFTGGYDLVEQKGT